ncbi:hypothetical protein [Eremococcus coleocola]|uniref:hypothetical protein n=1 Tax=Eremococcus coleocola TaxID=88132 RepID=UPI000429C022|nr:hypothetical protein [Eremococcus coleocola]
MTNLFKETTRTLEKHGKSFADIKQIHGDHFKISISNFITVATRTNYDDGFGAQEVASDLTIKGDGFIMVRYEYDGAEGWQYIDTEIDNSLVLKDITRLSKNFDDIGWQTLKDLNQEVE